MKPPQVAPYGSRKTIFMNFVEICSTMYAPHPPRILLWLAGISRLVAPPGFLVFAAVLRAAFGFLPLQDGEGCRLKMAENDG